MESVDPIGNFIRGDQIIYARTMDEAVRVIVKTVNVDDNTVLPRFRDMLIQFKQANGTGRIRRITAKEDAKANSRELPEPECCNDTVGFKPGLEKKSKRQGGSQHQPSKTRGKVMSEKDRQRILG